MCLIMALSLFAGCQSQNAASSKEAGSTAGISGTDIVGKITAIDGDKITLALGTISQGEKPQVQSGSAPDNSVNPDATSSATTGKEPPSASDGQGGGSGGQGGGPNGVAQGGSDGGNNKQPPSTSGSTDGNASGAPNGKGPGNGMGGSTFTASGEEITITVTDSTVITLAAQGGGPGGGQGGAPKQNGSETSKNPVPSSSSEAPSASDGMNASETGSLSDLAVGDIITVTMSGDAAATIKVQPAGDPGGPGGQNSSDGSSESMTLSGATAVDGATKVLSDKTYDSSAADQNTILVTNGGSAEINGVTLTKSGNTSSAYSSNFYGLNAILAVRAGSTASVSDASLSSTGEGANAVFATGEGASITVKDVKIHTTGNSARGLDATYGGTISATNVDISTEGAHCAPIATDRGEGVVTVNGGTLSAAGDGSPNIYSTGNITVTGVNGTAAGSQIAVVEGKNSITIDNCTLMGAGKNGIMLYQSTSGDASEGTAKFDATDCTLSTTSTGPMFYITNTDAEATLTNTTLNFTGGTLAEAAGNDTNNWGTVGKNGGNFTLTGDNQVLTGNIACDNISTVALVLKDSSTFTGSIDKENTAKQASISLDSTSVWNVTTDSYVTAITNALENYNNIVSNGHIIYYDATNTANAWLNGTTITLVDGGKLTPAV